MDYLEDADYTKALLRLGIIRVSVLLGTPDMEVCIRVVLTPALGNF